MANSKKIHIRTVTFERCLITGERLKVVVLFCFGCGQPREMLTVDEASAEAGISMRDLFRLSEDCLIHLSETDSGQSMFCRESLIALRSSESLLPSKRTL